MIGPNVLQAVADVKEVLKEHNWIVATELPIITSHAADCGNPERCGEDWYAVWWNGMGRFLLDGWNPLKYDDALKRFEGLEFGEMGYRCKKDMLALVKEGFAFRHAYHCVKSVGAQLAEKLIAVVE